MNYCLAVVKFFLVYSHQFEYLKESEKKKDRGKKTIYVLTK